MRKLLFLLTIPVAFMVSCKPDEPKEVIDISQLESKVAKDTSTTLKDSLVDHYYAYITAHPEDEKRNMDFIMKSVKIFIDRGDYQTAIANLKESVIDYPRSKEAPYHAALMADLLYKKLNRKEAATAIVIGLNDEKVIPSNMQDLKELLPKPYVPLDSMISVTGNAIQSDTSSDGRFVYRYVDYCEAYAFSRPKQPNSPDLLMKAAEISKILRTYDKTFQLFDWVTRAYPDTKQGEQALFLKGFMLDNDLKMYKEAGDAYDEYIKKYPNGKYIKDVKAQKDNLGKFPDQIIKK